MTTRGSPTLPKSLGALNSQTFSLWLMGRSFAVLDPQKENEVMRYCGLKEENALDVGIIYKTDTGRLTFNRVAARDYEQFLWDKAATTHAEINDGNLREIASKLREIGFVMSDNSFKGKIKTKLFKRYGGECFFCPNVFKVEQLTVEHLIPRSVGGGNSYHNMVLACSDCNSQAGAMHIMDKVRLRDAKRRALLKDTKDGNQEKSE